MAIIGLASIAKLAPSTLYVRRNVTNAQDLIDWAKANGFPKTVQAGDMHVTIAHSSTPLDWSAAGDHFDTLKFDGAEGRSVAPLGDKGAVVLKFPAAELSDRWQKFKDAGASWDFPSYQPHVTITYDGSDLDMSGIEPYAGPIEFGPEIFEPLTDGWADSVVEKMQFRIRKIDEGSGLVYGWAIVCEKDGEPYYDLNVDRHDDGSIERVPEHIPPAAMIKAALEFAMSAERPGNVMHAGPDSGSYPFIFPMTAEIAKGFGFETQTTGLMIAYKPTPEVLKGYREGRFTGFSIEGKRISAKESAL